MKIPKIVSIVPALPPLVNGLGDFSYLLAKELKDEYNWDTIFLNTDPLYDQDSIQDFSVESISRLASDQLLSALCKVNPDIVMIHYVGYAYNSNGIPQWLIQGLRGWRIYKPAATILVFFHELYANGFPWQKPFWTKPFQKSIAFALCELSDFSIANTEITFEIFRKRFPHKNVSYIPVFSNIQEPTFLPANDDRQNRLIMFGSAAIREKLFKSPQTLELWLKKLKIEQIIEIGPERKERNNTVSDVPLISTGILHEKQVSDWMLKSRFGILQYPQTLLPKSGVFAAYASHGLVPIIVDDKPQIGKELIPEEHYLNDVHKNANLEEIIKNVNAWYQSHNLKETAVQLYRLLKNN